MSASDKTEHKDPLHQNFVKKVGNLFKRAGFKEEEVIIKGPTSKGADIEINHLTEDGKKIKILIECKESEEFKEYSGLQNLIDSYSKKVQREKADLALLILKGYSIPTKYLDPEEREKIRKKDKVVYWDNDAWKLGGKPVIKGTRIPIALVLELLANGMKPDEIVKEYPELSPEDIKAALLYAARLTEK